MCEEAKCPNIGECWGGGESETATATIMVCITQTGNKQWTNYHYFSETKEARKLSFVFFGNLDYSKIAFNKC